MTGSRPGMPVRLAAAAALTLLLYFALYRPWQLTWGATGPETLQTLPGDEIVLRPVFAATRSVTIQAAPERIWPWLVQLGTGRAGWYSYDLIDNGARPSAEQIIPGLQNLQPGDLIPISPDGKIGLRVKDLQAPVRMLWRDREGRTSWLWMLIPQPDGAVRLITRVRMRYHFLHWYILPEMAMDAGDFVMMRQSMLGIKARAEGKAAPSMLEASTELGLWLGLFATFVTALIRLVRRPDFWIHLGVAAVAGTVTIAIVMWQPPVWIDGAAVFLMVAGLRALKYLKMTGKP